MKKLLVILGSFLLLFVLTGTAHADEGWDLTGDYTINFVCTSGCGGTWTHVMSIDTMDMSTGDFSGTGNYLPGTPTWTVTGNVSGTDVTFTVDYDGSTYEVSVEGTIANDGTMSGTAEGPGQEFTWSTTEGAASMIYKNHGQYVKSQENKKEAAQSRVGMPSQSKGHTRE